MNRDLLAKLRFKLQEIINLIADDDAKHKGNGEAQQPYVEKRYPPKVTGKPTLYNTPAGETEIETHGFSASFQDGAPPKPDGVDDEFDPGGHTPTYGIPIPKDAEEGE